MLRRSRGHVPGGAGAARSPRPACWPAGPSSRAPSAWPRARARGSATTSATCATTRRCAPSPRASRTSSALFAVTPEVVAHDLHPDYLSTTYALAREGVEHVAVQHHHAHLAACLAEHGERGPAVGAIYDGTGLRHATARCGAASCSPATSPASSAPAHLWPVRLPGGDRAVRQPWRMACAWLAAVQGGEPPPLPGVDPRALARGRRARAHRARRAADDEHGPAVRRRRRAVRPAHRGHLRGPGRGRARGGRRPRASAAPTRSTVTRGVLDARATVAGRRASTSPPASTPALVAARFHRAVARATAQACAEAAGRARPRHRRALRRRVPEPPAARAHDARCSRDAGLRVLVPERLPPNDGAISFGQAAVAAALSAPTR